MCPDDHLVVVADRDVGGLTDERLAVVAAVALRKVDLIIGVAPTPILVIGVAATVVAARLDAVGVLAFFGTAFNDSLVRVGVLARRDAVPAEVVVDLEPVRDLMAEGGGLANDIVKVRLGGVKL